MPLPTYLREIADVLLKVTLGDFRGVAAHFGAHVPEHDPGGGVGDELGVADALPKALAYCEAQGADSVELLREAGLGDELVESVRAELPRAKALVLAKRLR